jgi:hypothetical protein
MKKPSKTKVPYGWMYHASKEEDYEVGIDTTEKHSGSRCAYIKSTAQKRDSYGTLSQVFMTERFLGKRLKLSAWVKTKLAKGKAQLFIGTDEQSSGNWKMGCFDNMDDRPIQKDTKWQKYELVVDVPKTSNQIMFGIMLFGKGHVWLDDVSFEAVSKDVSLTGTYHKPKEPINLSFEEEDKKNIFPAQ